ncbi:universal stress protein [Rothia sp. AR01]|uniref:Universal stress protein n=1 Tax=Rothia santali TaxID=2949643 RepID=A0A9X2HEU4_9MICC|nr:universal stress protein [Rothia santali]MCP3426402.1 universal stress protein [Rothia santali]
MTTGPHERNEHHPGPVVVGVVPGIPLAVVAEAAGFAEHFRTELICVSVDASRYSDAPGTDEGLAARPIDPDAAGDDAVEFDPRLRAAIASVMECRSVSWSVRALAGGAARRLTRFADDVDASMIVVGTREAGVKGSLREFFNGSVAVQLAHTQRRPVVVIPLDPRADRSGLPLGRGE